MNHTGMDDRGSITGRGNRGIFLFATGSRLAVGLTQRPIQCVPAALVPGVKRPGNETDHSPSRAEVKNAWSFTSTLQHVFIVRCLVKPQGRRLS
jgi:hypothetical protein